MNNRYEWVKVGEIGVDAGLCWVGDPCYIIGDDSHIKEECGIESWDDFCDIIEHGNPTKQQFNYSSGHAGLGCLVSTGFGDGSYDVLAKVEDHGSWGKRVAELRIVFIDSDEN